MRHLRRLDVHDAVLVGCALALLVLVHSEGWIWPLKGAALMIPLSLLVG
jgi:hypothetical protein